MGLGPNKNELVRRQWKRNVFRLGRNVKILWQNSPGEIYCKLPSSNTYERTSINKRLILKLATPSPTPRKFSKYQKAPQYESCDQVLITCHLCNVWWVLRNTLVELWPLFLGMVSILETNDINKRYKYFFLAKCFTNLIAYLWYSS